ncbi:MAG TPA: folylpolyglutamate synthase/dihydrofolate synthase family protein [Salinivirgaceae bacterium]|nr:folylpolyglutamate synthase/dihydrofolate synthase family protein [Salinivirgaceae bacterium]
MTYQETLNYLYSQLPMYQRVGGAAYKADLLTTQKLDEYFNHPHQRFKSIHVAGTNGKGSVSHMLASVFQSAGYKTGLYTSPHMLDFRERIKINGQMIPENEVVDWVEHHKAILAKLSPSFFEMTVALAFDYFERQKVDIAIVEVGMGGRLDSTNIITPELSIITNIGLDHTQFLGNTLTDIAREKGGIIKEGVPVVVGEYSNETLPILKQLANNAKSTLTTAYEQFRLLESKIKENGIKVFVVENIEERNKFIVELDLVGLYQDKNIITFLSSLTEICKIFNLDIKDSIKAVKNTASTTGLMGRWQVLSKKPYIVADIAHNENGITETVKHIKSLKYKTLHIVLGVVNDKDVKSMLKLLPENAKFYFTQPSVPRALDFEKLYDFAKDSGFDGEKHPNVGMAIESALNKAQPDDMIYIGGSAFVVADALQLAISNVQ